MSNTYFKSIQAERRLWADSMPQVCMLCEKPAYELDIHEILRRSQAPRSWGFHSNYMLLCRACHQSRLITHSNHWSVCVQLGIKMIRDPKSYDLEKWNIARNPNALRFVTQEDVNLALSEYEES